MQDNPASPRDAKDLTSEQFLLVTKLAIPPVRSDVVPRPRLVNQLQLGIQRSLTLIAAPAGFGKTTLLSTWLELASLPAAWISLESDDDDLTRFWSYVFTALARVHPGSGTSALALLQASTLSSQPPIETVLTLWINDLATLPHEIMLVLDDYHLITGQPIHRSVTYLVDHLPSQLHLIIVTRADPPLPLARLRTRGHLTEIRVADLRFTAEETASFLTHVHGFSLAASDVAALAARTEGWIAGLQLAALSMQGHKDISGFLKAFTGSHRYIIDYLVEEVLAQQPESVQTFLLQTAILERLQGSLCEAVMGEPFEGQAMLEQLEQINLFLTPLDDERLWYRYHQLFAEALRHRLQRRQRALVPELHRRASIWYEQHGLLRDAVHHALAAADFKLAVRLMEQVGNSLVSLGEITTLQRWVAALPNELVRSRIEISVWQGWLLFVSGKHDEALQHLQDIERTFDLGSVVDKPREQQTIPPGAFNQQTAILGRIAAIRASIAITQGDLPRTITLSRLALEYLPKEYMARAYVAWYLGKAHWLSGDVEAASVALTSASHVSWEVNHLYAVFLVIHDLTHLQIMQGDLNRADQTCRQALQQALERGGNQPAGGPAFVVRGHLEREWNHLDAATSLLQEGIRLCEQTANITVIVQAYIELAFINQARGDTDGANAMMRQAVQRAERLPPSQSRGTQEVEASQVWLSLIQGDMAAASRWVQRCGLSVDQELSHLREREYLTLVRILIVQCKLDEAIQWLGNLLQLAEMQGRIGSVIELLMLHLLARAASGETNLAMAQLARALSLAEPEGYVRLFVDEGAPMARLLVQMRRRPSGSTPYLEQLLALLDGTQNEEESDPSIPLPVPSPDPQSFLLSERELEVLRLIVAGSSNREIADQLVIAVSTVKWYVNAIYGKLQVESRTKAIAKARELNII